MQRSEEFQLKRERLCSFLSQNGLAGVVLARTDNFAWLGCGADSAVSCASEVGVAALAASPGGVSLIVNNIEAERLLTEELTGLELEDVRTFDWHRPEGREEAIADLAGSAAFAADDGSAGLPPLPPGFAALRYQLTAAEIARYRELGRDAALGMEGAAACLEEGMSEHDAAGLLGRQYAGRGITPVVLLVAADERIRRWRHPLARGATGRECLMLAACGRRKGLVAAVTRFVHFGELPAELRRRHRAVCEVDATMILSTRPGMNAGQVLAAAQRAYARVGFPDEWRLHHQGGAIGYQPREYKAFPGSRQVILADQAFAWNPSICGTKSEDTILARAAGPEVLTCSSPDWPAVEIEVEGTLIRRPDMLVR